METTLIISDMHVGSSVALCQPAAQLDDGGTHNLSRGQSWLWDNWQRLLEAVDKDRRGPLWTIVNGDAVEGDTKNRSLQLITRNPATLTRWTAEILDPLAKLSAGLFVLRGTAAHGGQSGNLEEDVAGDLGAIKCPETGAASWWSLLWQCAGVTMDIAHHPRGGAGGAPAYRRGFIDRMAWQTMDLYEERGERAPMLVIRSHVHRYFDSYGSNRRVRAITTPAWTLATEYIHRIAPSELADIGAVMVYCDNGEYEVRPYRFEPSRRVYVTKEAINGNDRE